MIPRYTTPEMEYIWNDKARTKTWLDIELFSVSLNEEHGRIPEGTHKQLCELRHHIPLLMQMAQDLEKDLKHDVAAFVKAAENIIGPSGKYFHYGLTSSDIVDTALSVSLMSACVVLKAGLYELRTELTNKCLEYKYVACAGRTHGQLAEPTTVGLKLLSHLSEIDRCIQRVSDAGIQMSFGKLSGAVGNYYNSSIKVEERVCRMMGLSAESAATQVIPRDRHAEVFTTFAIVGGALERLALNIRLLQQSGINEFAEGFGDKQVGSSAMPHKKNPILSENVCGIARMLRAYAQASLENIALWHERDISHSSVERIIAPDACNILHFAILRMAEVIHYLSVNKNSIADNLSQMSSSSRLLKSLIDAGISRDEAYRVAQTATIKDEVAELPKQTIDDIFYRFKL